VSHLEFLAAAYGVIFVVIALYVISVGRRQSHLDSELKEIEAELRRRSASTRHKD